MKIEDNLYKYLKLYRNSPDYLKRTLAFFYNLIPNSFRYGNKYRYFKKLIKKSKYWSKKEIVEFQLNQINELLKESRDNVPYYTNSLKNITLPIKSLEEFSENIPFITKDDLRNNYENFINKKILREETMEVSTGGTSGEPLKILYEKGVTRTKELVFMNDQWRRVGYKKNDFRVVFRSSLIRDRINKKYWEFDPINNRYYFSSFDLSDKVIKKYIDKINKIKPEFLHVYPSVLTIIASYMKNEGISFDFIKAVLSGSENTYPSQIKLFKEVFNSKVFRWYGLAEASTLAGSCEYNHMYHCYPTYSFTELIDSSGKNLKKIGKKGEIIGTTFDNYVMPLIRYRTGDFASYGGESCPDCGRTGLLFNEIEGRSQEIIYDFNGNKYSLGPFIFGIHDSFWSNIKAIQFEQFDKGDLIIKVMSKNLNEGDLKNYLEKIFTPKFNNNFKFRIKIVEDIPRTKTGKHKYLIQHIEQ